MSRRTGLLLLLLATSLLWFPAHAQAQSFADLYVVKVDNLDSRVALGRSAFIADVPAARLADWLSSPGAGLQGLIDQFPDNAPLPDLLDRSNTGLSWRRNNTEKLQLDAPSRLSWIVVDIHYTGTEETTVMLDLAGADGIAWSYIGPLGQQLSFADDFDLPQGGRPVYDANAAVPVRLAPQQSTRLHLTVLTISDEKYVSFDLLNTNQFRAQRQQQTVMDGAYYGLVLALILYNLFLYVALRRNTHLYFCLFAAASAGMIYVSSALSLVFGLQNPLPLSLPLIYLSHGLVYILGAIYSMHLLNIDMQRKPWFHVWTSLILLNLLTTFWLVYTARGGGYTTDNISSTFITILLLWALNQLVYLATVIAYWRQSLLARLWFFGISIHISIMGLWPLILDSVPFTELAPYQLAQFTTLFNAILLSALIAYQFRSEQTARVQAQQKAVENLRIAHDLERAKSTFVANVGHDLRGPIQAISHFNTALKLQLPAHTHDTLQKIDGNIEKVSELIDSMIRLSRVEWHGTHPDLTPVALADILGELKTEISPLAAGKNLRLIMQDTQHQVLSDRVCLGQIFRNLVENAIKYTDKGEVRVSVSDDLNFVSVIIWDTGRGISEEHLPHIFEEFYQTTQADSSGVGLGLAIVERLCRLLDIQISVASTPRYGTRFTLKLKKYQPQAPAPAEPSPAKQAPLPSSIRSLTDLTVLAISQSDCLGELSALLVSWGADVRVVADRKELEANLHDEDSVIDVILCDRLSFSEHQKLITNGSATLLTVVVANTGHQPIEGQQLADTIVINQHISPMQFRSLIQRRVAALRQAG